MATYRAWLVREATRAKGRLRSLLHCAAPGLIGRAGDSSGFIRLLERRPALRQLAPAQARCAAAEPGIELDHTSEVYQCARDAATFYQGRAGQDAVALEIDINTEALHALAS